MLGRGRHIRGEQYKQYLKHNAPGNNRHPVRHRAGARGAPDRGETESVAPGETSVGVPDCVLGDKVVCHW